jgi:DNA-binding transcriptional MerR regulator
MRQTSKVEGTKIAQAAKDLNVTSVTIRRYLTEFNIETATDENGIKVLPRQAMEELKMVRSLKEDGLTNPKVMELLEANRVEGPKEPSVKKEKEPSARQAAKSKVAPDGDSAVPETRKASKRQKEEPEESEKAEAEEEDDDSLEGKAPSDEGEQTEEGEGDGADQKPKHSLTCQTCGKVFEHMNPRLRDCLDCYRTKRKERRRGGSDRHKNVIQHPIAQQVVSKAAHQSQTASAAQASYENGDTVVALPSPPVAPPISLPPSNGGVSSGALQRGQVRNYRKAIEETRQITGSLKRRLERPDLPEGDRRWLEQIYAYQLILHQGWRHLSDYKNNTNTQLAKQEE